MCGEPMSGRQEALFGGALIVGGLGLLEWGRKSHLGPAEIGILAKAIDMLFLSFAINVPEIPNFVHV